MNGDAAVWLRELTGRNPRLPAQRIQNLWGGYGQLERVSFEDSDPCTLIVKRIRCPAAPRDPAERRSHERKQRSYEVERYFYANHAARCSVACRVPRCLGSRHGDVETLLVLEDLATAIARPRVLDTAGRVAAGLDWLAAFHATFLGDPGANLWERGTYWHLATRPDELELIRDSRLGRAAPALDRALRRARYQTIVHGDAKLENFLFDESGAAAAVDFQYVGPGPGIVDVAYFLGSVLTPSALSAQAEALLNHYFRALRSALSGRVPAFEAAELEGEWRGLYAVAWADFHRFLAGWAPREARTDDYGGRLSEAVLDQLERERRGRRFPDFAIDSSARERRVGAGRLSRWTKNAPR